MAFDIDSLEPHIRNILDAPGTDLGTISARRIRKQLLGAEPFVDDKFLKVNKKEVDLVITRVYEEVVTRRSEDVDEKEPQPDRKRVKNDEEDNYDTPTSKKTKHVKKLDLESSDAEFARRLSNEINARSSRRSAAGRSTANGSSRKVARKKSSNFVESEDDSENNAGRKGGKAKGKSGGTARGGFAKEYTLSEPLAAVLQMDRSSRPQVVKRLWDYIKGNGLQNPANMQEILCDAKLKAVFNVNKINMLKMNKSLSDHLHDDR